MSVLLHLVWKVAEGDFGEGPKRAYWWLAGKKTWTGIALGVAWYALSDAGQRGLCAPCASYAEWLLYLSGILVSTGLLDKALRSAAPVP